MEEESEQPVTVPEDEGSSQHDSAGEEEEDEDECRVCRGAAEEGRPLFSPCKCSGSIGLTHQDCLASWLSVTRGEGRCELCKVKFRFAPQYAENTPDRLSVTEVLLGITRRAVARWLPFTLRLAFCLSLWLVVAPLLTAYIYLIWMNRSVSCIAQRWKWQLLPTDTVSGVVLAALILISFLSLMSFADFLRVEWQQQHNQQRNNDQEEHDGGPREIRRDFIDAFEEARHGQHGVDRGLLVRLNQERVERDGQPQREPEATHERAGIQQGDQMQVENQRQDNNEEEALHPQMDLPAGENELGNDQHDGNVGNAVEGNNNNNNNANGGGLQDNNMRPPPREIEPARQADGAPGQRNRLDRPFDANLDPLLQEDQVDMEINVALDELLGLRGPVSALLRNLLWLLVFNAVYVGFFAFIPRTIGSAVYSNVFNTTVFENTLNHLPLLNVENEYMIAMRKAFTDIKAESENLNTVFRLHDFAAVNLGYLSCASLVIMLRYAWILCEKCRGRNRGQAVDRGNRNNDDPVRAGARDEAQRLANAIGDRDVPLRMGDGIDHPGIALGEAVGLVLDATVAVVKVGILLFLKMFLLPVLLGIWLDSSSMDLFGSDAQERIMYAGRDLFSFVLLHWVAGITFMLFVTVSVLQLREVAHPDLLARLIRPQEPQPDLLGNLMHDSVVTQTRRMMLSLLIYTALLELHVAVPVKLLVASGVTDYLPFLTLKFWHLLMPELQVPLELLVFHLSMLALLEKYKNSIGEMQHHWLVFMTSKMGLADYIIPKDVQKFVLIGHIPVSLPSDDINPVLYDLASDESDKEEMILSNVERPPQSAGKLEEIGETKENGERVLHISQRFISLPSRGSVSPERSRLLPTKIGRFRFRRREDTTMPCAIEVWEESAGEPIPRPPEGWDDLGAGGADIQGRWAWGKEEPSGIERGVAQRSYFFGPHGHSGVEAFWLVAKIFLLLFFSWCATTLLLFVAVSAPLGVGRLLYFLFRVPEKYVHLPLEFLLGSCIVFPSATLVAKPLVSCTNDLTLRLRRWIGSFHFPPARKFGVMIATEFCWIIFCPWALGLNYELCLVKTPEWFAGEEQIVGLESVLLSWLVGAVLLNSWACLCSFNVFTKEFWANIGNGMLDAPPNGEGARRADRHGDDGHDDDHVLRWQGKHGRLSRCFSICRAVLSDWEWENVDHVVLLSECVIPISKNLGVLLVAPAVCCLGWFWFMSSMLGLSEVSGQYRLFIYRLATASTLLVQLGISFRRQIQRWFGAVHKTARDDRYLIGEILLNYQPDMDS